MVAFAIIMSHVFSDLFILLPVFQQGVGTVVGAGLGNSLSDFLGGATTASWDLAFGTAFGCLLGLAFIPIFKYINNKIRHD